MPPGILWSLLSQGAGTGVSCDIGQRCWAQRCRVGHQLVPGQLQRLGSGLKLPLRQEGLCAHQAQLAHHLGDATGRRGSRPSVTSGQTQLRLALVHSDAMVPDQGDLHPPPRPLPLIQLTTGTPSVSSVPKVLLEGLSFTKHSLRPTATKRIVPLEVSPAKKVLWPRLWITDHRPVLNRLRRGCTQVALPIQAHGVDG